MGTDTEIFFPKHRHTVLLVDDEQRILAALMIVFRNEPYTLLTSTSPEEALRFVKKVPVSAVITDFRMPMMDGLELLDQVRQISPKTIRILFSGDTRGLMSVTAESDRVRWMFSKPWDSETLRRVLRHLLREKERREAKSVERTP